MKQSDIKQLERQAVLFESRVDQIKASLAPEGIVWYPYPTLKVFPILDRLLTGPRRNLVDLAAGDPILDLGCGDAVFPSFSNLWDARSGPSTILMSITIRCAALTHFARR